MNPKGKQRSAHDNIWSNNSSSRKIKMVCQYAISWLWFCVTL